VGDVVKVIGAGLAHTSVVPEVRESLTAWCDEEEEYLRGLTLERKKRLPPTRPRNRASGSLLVPPRRRCYEVEAGASATRPTLTVTMSGDQPGSASRSALA
jgi:hypothetical protein